MREPLYQEEKGLDVVKSVLPWLRAEIGKINHLGWMNKNPAQILYNFSLDIFGRALTVLAREILSIGILHKFFAAILCILTIDFYPVM